MLSSRAAAAGLLFLWCGACPGVWQGELKCLLLTFYTFRFSRCSFWKREALTGAELIGFSVNELPPTPNSTGDWFPVVERQYGRSSPPEKWDSQWGPRGLCLSEKFFLSDGCLDAHRRLTEPSEHKTNGEKASGLEGGCYPELQFDKEAFKFSSQLYFGKLDFHLLIWFKSCFIFSGSSFIIIILRNHLIILNFSFIYSNLFVLKLAQCKDPEAPWQSNHDSTQPSFLF